MKVLGIEYKTLLLAAMLLTGGMASAQVVIKGTLYGGGKGIYSDQETGLVTGNTTVIMNGGIVERSLYGGGELGSVGTFTEFYTEATGAHVAGEPKTCATGTGKTEVLIRGGQVGRNETVMPDPGATTYEDDLGYVFCGSRGEADSLTYPLANLYAVVKETHLKISGSALVTASVYGGCENGMVMGNTHVEITGGQIGTGYNEVTQEHDGLYTEEQWTTVIEKIKNGTFTDADASNFHECDHWPYGDENGNYYTYDIYAEEEGYDSHGGALYATDGHTFYGNVFGGGSGYYPFWDEENTQAVWRRSAGRVWGNTVVDIIGGHILTSIYGGNEQTDVMGNSTVNMTGGTLGVPRTLQAIQNHPVTCYVFGAGKGDQRSPFSTWTNVQNAEVNISDDAFVFGSVFGGGEDGHVLSDATVNIGPGVHIGTYGYSYVDGNVFGGGRGFSGETIAAGSVGGNVEVNISGGTMLGSVYGGGRLASAGIGFSGVLDPEIGYFQPDVNGVTHGHVTINITGGTIGNDYESKLHLGNPNLEEGRSYGGNVFGGSMGRLTKLNGSINPLWPVLGQVKTTEVNISNSAIIKGNVFGGGEFGLVLDTTNVNISGGTIWRNVYGGGYGSNDHTTITDVPTAMEGVTFRYTPMAFAGVVSKTANVNISGGWVKKNVYGGGERGSVGLIDYSINDNHQFINITKHENEANSFALSWPYKYEYFEGFTGNTHVNVTGGRIGITGKDFMGPWNESGVPMININGEMVAYNPEAEGHKDALKAAREDNGDVYGGGHGIAGDRYDMAFCANADSTSVIVNYTSTDAIPANYAPSDWQSNFYPTAADWVTYGSRGCIAGSVYGGGENGHVLDLAEVTFTKGLIGHAIYGGGKGKDTYTVSLLNLGSTTEHHDALIYSLTAGKVYGNTVVTVNAANNTDAYVLRNIYGGGNMASVGKGNYAGGSDDYSIAGYGEKVANLWTGAVGSDAWHFLNSGKTTVTVTGGTVGTASGKKDDLPTGNVFGGCRGEAAPNIPNSPRYHYAPSFFSGYVNKTDVTIGRLAEGTEGEQGYVPVSGPLIYGSVYGGGEDGHVRRCTNVTVNYGEVGLAYTTANINNVGTDDLNDTKWLNRGNVYGGGTGLSKYEYDLPPYDGTIDENHEFTYVYGGRTITLKEKDYSNSSGSVTDSTLVVVNGGTVYHNVYGGGSLASVGPPFIPGTIHGGELGQASHWSKNIVTVANGTVGESTGVIAGYGGHVFGACRGDASLDIEKFSTSVQTQATIGSTTTDDALVYGHVHGGGEIGIVSDDTEANVISGQVGTIAYTDSNSDGTFDGITHVTGGYVFGGGMGLTSNADAARVKGNSNVNISGGKVYFNVYGGGEMASVGTVSLDGVLENGLATVTVTGGQVGPAPKTDLGYNIPIGLNGFDGNVFGGGKGEGDDPIVIPDHPSGQYYNHANVNSTVVTIDIPMPTVPADSVNNRIWGGVFGGAEDGHVLGDAKVIYKSGYLGTLGTSSYDGNIFGGGRNYQKKNYTAGFVAGNTTIEMCGGQIFGTIFGGGRLGITGISRQGIIQSGGNFQVFTTDANTGNTLVKVKGGKIGNEKKIETFTKFTMGDVYGGGKGDMVGIAGHDVASALLFSLTRNTEVIVSDSLNSDGTIFSSPIIYGNVFGGGEVANVGNYAWTSTDGTSFTNIHRVSDGQTKVTISGGRIGVDRMRMHYELVGGTGDDRYDFKYNTVGNVFGGGEGYGGDPEIYPNPAGGNSNIVHSEYGDKYLTDVMATVGSTFVTITDTTYSEHGNVYKSPWVKGSVYGGAPCGHVLGDTRVRIKGGQIGAGDKGGEDQLYTGSQFIVPTNTPITTDNALEGTHHWDYNPSNPQPFDPILVSNGTIPSDGKTWFGNVFGGGSGYVSFVKSGTSHWNREAGKVYGNSTVEISGGHILSRVYGGNELTDVGHFGIADAAYHDEHSEVPVGAPYRISGGKATIKMSGGTVGVPRTAEQIASRPTISNLFGGGCGDPRPLFNNYTNVDSTHVEITGGIVYGTVFGGAEDGHVLDSTNVRISQAAGKTIVIGSSGLSGVDGNVYGGGKGKDQYLNQSDMNFASGRVGGNTHVRMMSGTVLGSIFGGGKVALTGVDVNGSFTSYINDSHVYDSTYHGRTMVEVSGGKVGNDAHDGLDLLMSDNDLGNVYGGGRGKYDELIEDDLGRVANSVVKISGNPQISSSVFGGGQMANVGHWNDYTILYTEKTGTTRVTITDSPTIGTAKEFEHYSDEDDLWTWYDVINGLKIISHTCTGNVFGGGQGDVELDEDTNEIIGTEQGHCRTTIVDISGTPTIMSSVFGGSEDGNVWGNTSVKISGGTIGKEGIEAMELNASNQWVGSSRTYSFGNVFGGSYGKDAIIHLGYNDQGIIDQVNAKAGRIYGNTSVEITGGAIRGNVFGGSNYATVEGNTVVKISETGTGTGPEIGPLDGTGMNAYVLGGGKGFHEDPDELRKAHANVNGNTKVIVEGGKIWGSVFGGGSDAHTLGNTEVYIHEGAAIGDNGLSTWDGNIFGGGRNFLNSNHTNGRVAGNVSITMDGGSIQGSIFGGGRLALTGVDVDGNPFLTEPSGHVYDSENHGMVTITVSGNTTSIGNPNGEELLKDSDESVGDIFGSGKGDTKEYDDIWAGRVANTKITVKGSPHIYGSVFGGGEMASIGYWYENSGHKQVFYDNSGASEVIIGESASDGLIIGTETEYSAEYAADPGDWTIYDEDGKLIHTCTGNVFGASQGDIDIECPHWVSMGRSRTSKVTVNGGTIMSGVFGGSEQGTVAGHTSVTINNGTIGTVVTPSSGSSYNFGRVIGGGYGCDNVNDLANTYIDDEGVAHDAVNDSTTALGGLGSVLWRPDYLAGRVYGHSRVYFNDGTLYGDVFGGSDRSIVSQERVANINGGTVKGHVYGGGNSETTNTQIGEVLHSSLKTVNVRGGQIEGSVFGSSNNLQEGIEGQTESSWQSFVNITGGTIDGDVYAAGYGGHVFGSVATLIGANAIVNAPTYLNPMQPYNQTTNPNANVYYGDSEDGTAITPTPSKLIIRGSVYGGSHHFGHDPNLTAWNDYDVSTASVNFIDGTGYDTQSSSETAINYMAIEGGLFGSGARCESGALGREFIVSNYGHRNSGDEFTQATRNFTTIQRCGLLLFDHVNVNLTGATDISTQATGNFGVLKIDLNFFVANGSAINLGSVATPAFMDSIKDMRSVCLKEGENMYNQVGAAALPNWEMVGIQNDNNTLYHIKNGTTPVALTPAQENVIIFKGLSKLWVRYQKLENGQSYNKYGHLYGFFRMRGDSYQPYGTTSFAYARPKITDGQTDNTGDGGFLSYNNDYNFFTDNGAVYTKTKQHPYTNVLQFGKDDRVDYREWVIIENTGRKWYVDGTRNWGRDDRSKNNGWGLYPDKPKKTLCGAVTYNSDTEEGNFGGVITETEVDASLKFDFEKDIIYIVGALSAEDEGSLLHSSVLADQANPLLLYRYPGGHTLSNGSGYLDWGIGTDPTNPNTNTGLPTTGTDEELHAGPGPNYGALLIAQDESDLTLLNDQFDGLYGFLADDIDLHNIPTAWPAGTPSNAKVFTPALVTEPLVVTEAGATLTLKGSTTLMRGYNNTDAATTWYNDADYVPSGDAHHGGALFVAPDVPASGEIPARITTVNVEGLVTITGNLQRNGGTIDAPVTIASNVYLPTFSKSLTISGESNLHADTRIGVTSPNRNTDPSYVNNTLSPVAVASIPAIAENAWQQRNFRDDQGWFFVNGHTGASPRTTYYYPHSGKAVNNQTLYFGWTWANVVRKAPAEGDLSGAVTDAFDYSKINSPYDLAWLISQSTGMNGQTAINFSEVETIKQTADIDMRQYVWVPIGEDATGRQSFAGTYDGQGHLITNLSIDYIGLGDRLYEREDYGMFGYVKNGTVNRTFVVSGYMSPKNSTTSSKDEQATVVPNIGGLAGHIGTGATITSSEAAVEIMCPNYSNDHDVIAGGLVGQMDDGTIHSSMAMPYLIVGAHTVGHVGGLVGESSSGGIYNSFANSRFGFNNNNANKTKAGGLIGHNANAVMSNCYANLRSPENISSTNFGGIVANNGASSSNVKNCYVMQNPTDITYNLVVSGSVDESCGKYAPVIDADKLGYMYADNRVTSSVPPIIGVNGDSTMFYMLNRWVQGHPNQGYARWARPGLPEINGDLPVLLLSEDDLDHNHQGGFRSMGTYAGSHVLQYGGPVRDVAGETKVASELDVALTRPKADELKSDYLFVYGDIIQAPTSAATSFTQSKVSIYENASIKSAGTLSDYTNTYVGITFDNSNRHAYSTPGMNYGIVGMGGFLLPRDWHMFSSPLSAAPQGFNYKGQNSDTYADGTNYSVTNFYNNPWVTMDTEFSWLNGGTGGNHRYWMKGWSDSQITDGQEFNASNWADGYFPSSLSSLHPFGTGWISNTDEYGRYPYGMDFYTWYEPDYHWVNFKRNGPNHWHSDVNDQGVHEHLDYYGDGVHRNVNEETLVTGRGYMAAISVPTFMQSHGAMNEGAKSIQLTKSGAHCTGWNLVGNPYHGFLDFDDFAEANKDNLATKGNNPFYVIYDADAYTGEEGSGFLYYPQGGSQGGEYAGHYIHPHQGFFVLAKEAEPIQFNEGMLKPRSTVQADSLFREWQPSYPLINLYLSSDNGCRDVAVIEFNRPEWGGATKLRELRQGNGAIYGYHDEQRYAALFAKEGTPRVPLWFEAHEDDIFTMKWKTANADFHSLYLIDNLTGIQYDMLANDTYVFEGHKQDYYSRFYIVFDVTDVEEHDGNDGFVFFEGSQWMVTGDGDLDFIDMNGRVLWTGHVSGQQRVNVPAVAAGIYMFRLVDSNSVKIQKVIVKKQ